MVVIRIDTKNTTWCSTASSYTRIQKIPDFYYKYGVNSVI